MKVNEIVEDKHLEGYKLVMHAAKEVAKNCKLFLEGSKGLPMYRGMPAQLGQEGKIISFAKKTIRTDRRPRNSGDDAIFQWTFNTAINEMYKIPAVRNMSLFATGSENFAGIFGDLYFVFPIGKFNYLWSPEVHDSYEDITLNKNISYTFDKIFDYYKWAEKVLQPFLRDKLNVADYKLSTLKKSNDENIRGIKKWLVPVFKDEYKYQYNTDLEKAIKSSNEIFIIAPGEYYILSVEFIAKGLGIYVGEDDSRYVYKKFLEAMEQIASDAKK